MRGECRGDYRDAMSVWRENNLNVTVVSYEQQHLMIGEVAIPIPDFVLVIESTATEEQLVTSLRVADNITDLHVIYQTLREVSLYTGERNYDL